MKLFFNFFYLFIISGLFISCSKTDPLPIEHKNDDLLVQDLYEHSKEFIHKEFRRGPVQKKVTPDNISEVWTLYCTLYDVLHTLWRTAHYMAYCTLQNTLYTACHQYNLLHLTKLASADVQTVHTGTHKGQTKDIIDSWDSQG